MKLRTALAIRFVGFRGQAASCAKCRSVGLTQNGREKRGSDQDRQLREVAVLSVLAGPALLKSSIEIRVAPPHPRLEDSPATSPPTEIGGEVLGLAFS